MSTVALRIAELRAVAAFAVGCAQPALPIFERARPGDVRPRVALDVAQQFADGSRRTKVIRDAAWAAQRAYHQVRDDGQAAAGEAARAALAAASAPYLHPLANATQVGHILGAAAHAARAFELCAGDDPAVGRERIAQAQFLASPVVVDVLRKYPAAPPDGGRVGELMRALDLRLREGASRAD
jgi:hypothetical protein